MSCWSNIVVDLLIQIIHVVGDYKINVRLMTINQHWCKILHLPVLWNHSECAMIRVTASSCTTSLPAYLSHSRARSYNCGEFNTPTCTHTHRLSDDFLLSGNVKFHYLDLSYYMLYDLQWYTSAICNIVHLQLRMYQLSNALVRTTDLGKIQFPCLTTFKCYNDSAICDRLIRYLLLAMPVVQRITINLDKMHTGEDDHCALGALSSRLQLTSLNVRLPAELHLSKWIQRLGALPIQELLLRKTLAKYTSTCSNALLQHWLPNLHSLDFYDHSSGYLESFQTVVSQHHQTLPLKTFKFCCGADDVSCSNIFPYLPQACTRDLLGFLYTTVYTIVRTKNAIRTNLSDCFEQLEKYAPETCC